MLRRHFFLIGALAVLVLMVVVGGLKLVSAKSAGPGGGSAAQQGGPPGGGAGGRRGGAGGFGGGPTQVSVAVIAPRTFADEIEVLGVAKGRQSVTLTAATTQLVDRVHFADGQSVPRGAVLVELKNTEQDASLAQAEAALVQADRAYERYKTLGQQGWASKAQIWIGLPGSQ